MGGQELVANGTVHLRDRLIRNSSTASPLRASKADLQFTDFEKVQTKPGHAAHPRLRTGQLPFARRSTQGRV